MERGINCYQVGGSEAEEVIKSVCVWGRGGGGGEIRRFFVSSSHSLPTGKIVVRRFPQ